MAGLYNPAGLAVKYNFRNWGSERHSLRGDAFRVSILQRNILVRCSVDDGAEHRGRFFRFCHILYYNFRVERIRRKLSREYCFGILVEPHSDSLRFDFGVISERNFFSFRFGMDFKVANWPAVK